MDAKEKHRLAKRVWAAKHRAEKKAYDYSLYWKLREENKIAARLGHCQRCDTLLSKEETGDGKYCGWCLNEMGII